MVDANYNYNIIFAVKRIGLGLQLSVPIDFACN